MLAGCSRRVVAVEEAITKSRSYSRKLKFRKQIIRESEFRQAFFKTLKSKYQIDAESRQDTLILVEYFDNICINCDFFEITLLAGDTAYAISKRDYKTQFVSDSVSVSKVSFKTHGNLIGDGLWKLLYNKNLPDPFNSKLYGKPCFDGARANITWILPKLVCRTIDVDCIW